MLLLIFINYIYKNYHFKIEIKHKDKFIKHLKHKNEQQTLLNLRQEKLIQTLQSESKKGKISAKRWGVFVREYKIINPNLGHKLNGYQLSKTEFRLAIFIANKLANPEIAELLSVNVETVYKQRQRLAKKVGFKSVKELNFFIENLN